MRRFKIWTMAAAISVCLAGSINAMADDDTPKPREGQGDRPGFRERFGEGDRPQRGEGFQRPGFAGRDPEQIAAMMIRQFDKDGDEKLDAKELAVMMTTMRERGGMMMGRPGGNPNAEGPGSRMREMMENRRRAGSEGADEAGGVRPKRPPMDEPKPSAEPGDAK